MYPTYASPYAGAIGATYRGLPQGLPQARSFNQPVRYASGAGFAQPTYVPQPQPTYGGQPRYGQPLRYGAPTYVSGGGFQQAQPKRAKGNFKVCVCGGAGGIGQPLAMLMAMDENVAELVVQDVTMALVPAAGVAADLSHIEKKCSVTSYAIDPSQPAVDQLEECMTGCHLVLVPAGVPRKPGMTRDDLFGINAGIAKGIVDSCAKYCPDAVVALIVNPVNSIVPAMCELYKKQGLDPQKIVGVTTLDCVRANKFVAERVGVDPSEVNIPVIGGHAGVTIMPVFSQDRHARTLPADDIEALDKRTQDAGTEVVNAKNGKGSATLSMAYAGSRLGKAVLAGLAGTPTTESAYVAVPETISELPYFTTKVTFGRSGVESIHPVGALTQYEQGRLAEASAQLATEIETGLQYAAKQEYE